MTVHVAIKSRHFGRTAIEIDQLGPADTHADLMRYFDKPDNYAVPKTRSTVVDTFQGIFTSLMGVGLAKVEQSILTIMRSDEFLGSKWTPRELHFFLCETQFGPCVEEGQSGHFWTTDALDTSIRRALELLKQKGLVRHTVPRPFWFGMLPEIKWTLVAD